MEAIRAATAEDLALVRELRLRALAESPGAFAATADDEATLPEQDWVRRVAGDGDAVFVALAGERGVGMAGVRWFAAERGISQLWGMWVAPEQRRSGVGERLVGAVRAWTRQGGGRCVRLGVLAGSRDPAGFYERLGFVRTGEQRPYARDPSRLVFWMARPA